METVVFGLSLFTGVICTVTVYLFMEVIDIKKRVKIVEQQISEDTKRKVDVEKYRDADGFLTTKE